VQLYIDLHPATPLHESHRLGDAVRDAIIARYPNTDVLVHEEPAYQQESAI